MEPLAKKIKTACMGDAPQQSKEWLVGLLTSRSPPNDLLVDKLLRPIDLVCLSVTCTPLKRTLPLDRRMQESICKAMRCVVPMTAYSYVPECKSIPLKCVMDFCADTGSVVAGSCVLAALFDEDWGEIDMDLFTRHATPAWTTACKEFCASLKDTLSASDVEDMCNMPRGSAYLIDAQPGHTNWLVSGDQSYFTENDRKCICTSLVQFSQQSWTDNASRVEYHRAICDAAKYILRAKYSKFDSDVYSQQGRLFLRPTKVIDMVSLCQIDSTVSVSEPPLVSEVRRDIHRLFDMDACMASYSPTHGTYVPNLDTVVKREIKWVRATRSPIPQTEFEMDERRIKYRNRGFKIHRTFSDTTLRPQRRIPGPYKFSKPGS